MDQRVTHCPKHGTPHETLTEGRLGTLRIFDQLLRFLSRRHEQLEMWEQARQRWEQQLRTWALKREAGHGGSHES
jgi:hypothetical protein